MDQLSMTEHRRRFPPPWTVEDKESYFIVRDHNGQALAYVTPRTSGQVPSHSRATRRGGSRPTLRSCRGCCGGGDNRMHIGAVRRIRCEPVESRP
jgi:hypothetical protein